jgi:hypothetical protein
MAREKEQEGKYLDGWEFHPGNPTSHHQTGSAEEPGIVAELGRKYPDVLSKRSEDVLNDRVLHSLHDESA